MVITNILYYNNVLLPGLHAVADIFCDCCKTTLGWKYEHAFESSQKYKEGKFIIELAHMIKENGWEKESWRYVTLDNKNFLLLIGVSLVSWNVRFLQCCRHLLNIHLRLLIWLLLPPPETDSGRIYQVKTNLTPPFFRSISSHIQFIKKNIFKNCFHHQLFFDQRLLMAVTDQVVEHLKNEIFSIVNFRVITTGIVKCCWRLEWRQYSRCLFVKYYLL